MTEDRLLYLFSRQDLEASDREQVRSICAENPIDWTLVYSLAFHHHVLPLVAYHLQRFAPAELGLPPALNRKFQKFYHAASVVQSARTVQLRQAIAYFRQRGIAVMLVKGVALEQTVYQKPWLVTSRDMDIVLRQRRDEITESLHQEYTDHFRGSRIEFDYYDHHDITLNGALPIDFEQVWERVIKVEVDGQEAFAMAPEDLLLSLCINSCRRRYFRLKSLFDIAETIAHYPELDWHPFVQRTVTYRCHNIVYSALLVAQATIGCAVPDEVFPALSVHPWRAALIRTTVRFLVRYIPLSQLSFYTGPTIAGRTVGLSLLLPYITYDCGQARMKLVEAYRAWRSEQS